MRLDAGLFSRVGTLVCSEDGIGEGVYGEGLYFGASDALYSRVGPSEGLYVGT